MKTFTVTFKSSDNVSKTTDIVANSEKEALETVKRNYPKYKCFKIKK